MLRMPGEKELRVGSSALTAAESCPTCDREPTWSSAARPGMQCYGFPQARAGSEQARTGSDHASDGLARRDRAAYFFIDLLWDFPKNGLFSEKSEQAIRSTKTLCNILCVIEIGRNRF